MSKKTTITKKQTKPSLRKSASEPFEIMSFSLISFEWNGTSEENEQKAENEDRFGSFGCHVFRERNEQLLSGVARFDIDIEPDEGHRKIDVKASYVFFINIKNESIDIENCDAFLMSFIGGTIWQGFRCVFHTLSSQEVITPPPLPMICKKIKIEDFVAPDTE